MTSYLRLFSILLIFASTLFVNLVNAKPSKVEIKPTNGVYQFFVNGQPFEIKGVGIDSHEGQYFDELKAAGGNAFRTWAVHNIDTELAKAKELGLMVAVGLNTHKELEGFDFNDEKAVKKQFEWVKGVVNQYKDHPNVLCWVIANEPNLLINQKGELELVNPKVYDSLETIIQYIHQVDPYHPVTYSFAGVIKEHMDIGLKRTPSVDFVSVQLYGDLGKVNALMSDVDTDKPYVVTEFGPKGHWEIPPTSWGREIEEASGPKARDFGLRMQQAFVENNKGKLMGGFAFLWGQKQERTPTWYGMLDEQGRPDGRVDELIKLWRGRYPEHRAPSIESIQLNKHDAATSIKLKPAQIAEATITFQAYQEHFKTHWGMTREVIERSDGGLFEKEPPKLEVHIVNLKQHGNSLTLQFKTPERPGEYRLFATTISQENKIGTANIPFLVE